MCHVLGMLVIYIGVHGIGMVVYVLFCGGHFIG